MSIIADFDDSLACLIRRDELDESLAIIHVEEEWDSLHRSEIQEVISFVHEHPGLFDGFQIMAEVSETRQVPLTGLNSGIRIIADGFEEVGQPIDIPSETSEEVQAEIRGHLSEGNMQNVQERLSEWGRDVGFDLSFDIVVNKSRIGEQMLEELEISTPAIMHIWTSKSALQEWIEGSENIVDRAEDLFPTNSLPIFRFLYSSSIQANSYIDSGPIGEEELGQEDLGIETKYANYIEIIQRDRHLFESASNVPPVSPEIFDTEELRRIFREIFVFYAFVAFSDSVELVNNDWKLSLGFRSREIRDSIPMDGVGYWTSDFSESNLNSLYELYTEFVQEGLSETYNQLWKRSFVHQISNLSDIPTHANQISDYYQSLKEEAIETNFDELSDAIQDAHTFTVEVTNSISQTVRSLTNEIQKVVLTLLGAIFANVFLVLRWSNYEMVLPFTIFVISGVLLFYMPTINERIEQLDEIIKERSNDFDLYADTIEDYSGELFDFDNFRDRRDAYIQFAKRKRNWAVGSLELTFVLVVFVWIVLTIISLLYFPLRSVQYVAGVLSIPLLNIVNRKQAGTEYYPVDLDVINVSWPFRHSPPKMAEALMMLVLVSDVVIRLLEVKINI